MDLGSALMALLIGVVFKGAVIGVGGWLLLRLYGATYGQPRRLWLLLPTESVPEIRILWWSLLLFFFSELTCGIEIYVLFRSNPVLGAFHALTSAAGMGLFALGFYRFLDRKLLRFGGNGCLVNRICRGCPVLEGMRCKFRLATLLLATFVAMATAAPMFASTARMTADTRRYMLPVPAWNAFYDERIVPWLMAHYPYQPSGAAYFIPSSVLGIEYRMLPALALALEIGAIVLLLRDVLGAGVRMLVGGLGVLCYSYFELVLYRGTGDVILGSLGHEMAEFWFLVFTAELLRRSFPTARTAPAPSSPGEARAATLHT